MSYRRFVLDFATSLQDVAVDCPFEADFYTTVLRHRKSKKWFGILLRAPKKNLELEGDGYVEILNLKCDPSISEMMRENFPAVKRAYHMNKTHWVSVVLEGGLPKSELVKLIRHSYFLTSGSSTD